MDLFFICLAMGILCVSAAMLGLWIGDKLSSRAACLICAFLAFGLCVIMGLVLPFSPSHDSYDMLDSLRRMISGRKLGSYYETYYAFYVTNKLAAYFYFPLCKLLGSAVSGVRLTNLLLSYCFILFLAQSIGKIMGNKYQPPAFLAMGVIFPFVILSGPYIYPISLFLAALSLRLLLGKSPLSKGAFLPVFGLLWAIRITAALFIPILLVCHIVYTCRRKKEKRIKAKSVAWLMITILFCFLFQKSLGYGLYQAGLHPYKSLSSSAMTWTLDVGTRYNEAHTGTSSYTPYAPLEGDGIAGKFYQLWELYGSEAPYGEISHLDSQIKQDIIARSMDFYGSQPQKILELVYHKVCNLFQNHYRPYYYEMNYNSLSISHELHANLRDDYFAFFNGAFILFFAASVVTLWEQRRNGRKKDFKAQNFLVLSMILAFFCNAAVFVAFTEVMKRYLLDAWPALSVVIIYQATRLAQRLPLNGKAAMAAMAGGLLLAVTGLQSNNIPMFEQSAVDIISQNGKTTVSWSFQKEYPESYIRLPDGTTLRIEKHLNFDLIPGEMLTITTPGNSYTLLGFPLD